MPFIDAPADDFTTNAGNATDCGTTEAKFYDASTNPAQPPGNITILVNQDDFLFDALNGTISTPLSAHAPDQGGAYIVQAGAPEIELDGGGNATMPGTGDVRYTNTATPPSADYGIQVDLNGDAGYSDQTYAIARENPGADTYYYALADLANVLKLGKVVAGVDTILGTGAFTMPPLASFATGLAVNCQGTTIMALIDGTVILTATDASIPATGKPGVRQTRAVGQPVLISRIRSL